MTNEITHRAFFGDVDHAFALTDEMVIELEQTAQLAIGALYMAFPLYAVPVPVMRDIIRLGLIGAGTAPEAAKRLVDTYATNRPIGELFPLAFAILDARWNGAQSAPVSQPPATETAATDSLSASVKVAA